MSSTPLFPGDPKMEKLYREWNEMNVKARRIMRQAESMGIKIEPGLILNMALPPDTVPSRRKKPSVKSVTTKSPDDFVSMIDNLTRKAFNNELNGNTPEEVKTGYKVKTLAMVNVNELQPKDDVPFTVTDKKIHSAVASLYDAGNEYITANMIYKVYTGNDEATLPPNQEEEIRRTLAKMKAWVWLDFTEEAESFGYDEGFYEGAIIPYEVVTVKLNGHMRSSYHILEKPIFFRLASNRHQLRNVPIELLDVPNLKKTTEVTNLIHYLIERIAPMRSRKKTKRLKNKILYQTIFDELQITAESESVLNNKKLKIRQDTRAILQHFVNVGWIEGADETKAGKVIDGIEIDPIFDC